MHKSGETRPTAHTTLYHMYSIDYYSVGIKVSAHGDTGAVPSAGGAKRDARPNCLPNFRYILDFFLPLNCRLRASSVLFNFYA